MVTVFPDIVLSQTDATGTPVPAFVWTADEAGSLQGPVPLTDTNGLNLEWTGSSVDFDGDGQYDFMGLTPNQTPAIPQLYRHAGNKPDELKGIHDGFGKNVGIAYKSIGDSNVYTADAVCSYPQHCANKGLWVVSQYTVTSDWVSDTAQTQTPPVNTFNYSYASGRSDLRGRGWLGFGRQTVTNVDTGTTTVTFFDNGSAPDEASTGTIYPQFGYPKAGRPTQVATTATTPLIPGSSGTQAVMVTRTTLTTTQYDVQNANGTAFARPTQTETKVLEQLGTVLTGPKGLNVLSDVTTTYGYDDFNNVNARTTTSLGGETRTYSATYAQNTANAKYLLSMPLTSSETSTVPPQLPVKRTHTYDPDRNTGLLKDETIQPDGNPTQKVFIQYDRNAFGQVIHTLATAADPLNIQPAITREAWTTYDPTDGVFPATTTNALGHTTRTVYHPGLGVLVFSQDPNGVASHAQYDGFGRIRFRSTAGQPTVTTSYQGGQLALGQVGDIPGLYNITTSNSLGGSAFVTYDALSNEIKRGTKNHDGTTSYVQTVYTGVRPGQVQSVSRPFVSGATPVSTTYQYDALGRPTSQALPDGSVIKTFYNGLATTVVDANGYPRTRVLDDRGHLVQIDEDSAVNATSDPALANPPSTTTVVSTAYAYGPFDVLNSVSIRPRGGSTFTTVSSMLYDVLGRRTDLVDADRGHTLTNYDAFSEPVTDLDANGQTHIVTRDAIGRTTVDYSTQDGSAIFEWDTAANGAGKLAKATSVDGISSAYSYDSFGRGVETKWHIQGQDFAVDKVLDNATGRVKALEYPSVGAQQFSVTYGTDAIGQIASVTGSDSSAPLTWTATAWETDGQLNTETLNDGEQTIRQHDPARAWLKSIVTASTSGSQIQEVQDLHYDHDPNGNVKGRTDELLGTTETFGHDFLNRLHTWGFTSSQGTWNTTYNVDDLGNFQSRTMVGSGAPPVQTYQQYGARDGTGANPTAAGLHAVTQINGNAYSYDTKGNQLTAPGRTVTYSSFGLPRSVKTGGKTTTFTFDANHQRAYKKGAGGSTVYVGGLYEKRTDSSGKVTHVFFVPGGSRIVGQVEWTVDSSGAVNGHNAVYFHDDHLGSIESVTGLAATATHLKYEPFGARINPLDPTKTAKAPADITDGFTDQQHDDELGLINMQGRIYDPTVARFLSADPFAASPLTSQGFNRYSYVSNSPLGFVDPTGFIGTDDRNPCLVSNSKGTPCAESGSYVSGDGTVYFGDNNITGHAPDAGDTPDNGNTPGTQDGATTPQTDSNGTVTVTVVDNGNTSAQYGNTAQVPGASSPTARGFSGPGTPYNPWANEHGLGAAIAGSNNWVTSVLQSDQTLKAAQDVVLTATIQIEITLATGGIGEVTTAAEEGLQAARGATTVYQSVAADGAVQYVGITDNLEARAAAHLAEKGISIEPIEGLTNIAREDARAVEQVLIERYGLGRNGGTLLNKINSIAQSNPIYQAATARGAVILKSLGY